MGKPQIKVFLGTFAQIDCQRGSVTGVAFVDLSSAYDTIQHQIIIKKYLPPYTMDFKLTQIIAALLQNICFFM